MRIKTLHHGLRRFFSTSSSSSSQKISQKFEIRVSSPHINIDCHRDGAVPDNTAILLLGHSEATFQQLKKHSDLYNSLGYRTLACTLPLQFVFHYDVQNTIGFCKQVHEKLAEEGVTKVIPIGFSNFGSCVYQHLAHHISSGQWSGVEIVGTVLDSGPGPATLIWNMPAARLDQCDETQWRPGPGPWPPRRTFLAVSYFFINWVNRRSLRDILALGIAQLKDLQKKPDNVSWMGYWVKHQDRGGWPLLFIHSERDPLIPWRFVSSVVAETRRRGRRVEEWRLQDTGHVDHFKRHPEEYKERVATFLDSCLKS